MNKLEFIESQAVQSFTQWLSTKLDHPGTFNHSYIILKNKKGDLWQCNSIFNAFENYRWPFSYTNPLSNEYIKGSTFQESKAQLDFLSEGLRDSIYQGNGKLCQNYCIAILEWGGVTRHNTKTIISLGADIVPYFKNVTDIFRINDISLRTRYERVKMNSGFSKIYSLLINDFIIYDSRVGAALGLLTRKYCEETNRFHVPPELSFAYGEANGDSTGKRNPSRGNIIFNKINSYTHFNNNIRANWLLKYVLENSNSQFTKLDSKEQLRALEAALFMIGYNIL